MKKFYLRHIIATLVILCLLVYVWKWTPVPLWFSLIWIAGLLYLVITLLGGSTQLQIEELLRTEANILLEAKGIVNTIPTYLDSFTDEAVRVSLLEIVKKANLLIERLENDTLASLREANNLLHMLKRLDAILSRYVVVLKNDPERFLSETRNLLKEGEETILQYNLSLDLVVEELNSPDVMAYQHALQTAIAHLEAHGYSARKS